MERVWADTRHRSSPAALGPVGASPFSAGHCSAAFLWGFFLAPLTFRAAAGLGENLERKWRIKSEARKAEQRAWHKTGTPGNRWQH